MIIVALLVLGLCFGSFVNALVWRMHEQSKPKAKRKASDSKLSLAKGRSMCVHCGHELGASDLVPVLSWLSLRGKCRYCKKPISWQYPIVELITALLFIISYLYWPDFQDFQGGTLEIAGVVGFVVWLICLVGFMALIVYDLRWMLLPNKIIFPLLGLAGAGAVTNSALSGSIEPLVSSVAGMAVGGGLFYILFQLSSGKWIGGGDVKLGFLLGLLLGAPSLSFLMLFIASLLGSLVSIPLLISKKVGPKTRIPFGPFLISSAIIVQLFGEHIISWYLDYFMV